MRFQDPLIIGAGPAGCAAAIALANGGARPVILERALRTLAALGVDGLGGHPVSRVRVFAGDRHATARLPQQALGVSRHRLDTVMQRVAETAGAGIMRGVMVRHYRDGQLLCDDTDRTPESLFLATGKHDLRGLARPRPSGDPPLGLRVRLAAQPALRALIGDAVELFLFEGGYGGLIIQEDGSANLCLALRKSRLAESHGNPAALLRALGDDSGPLAARLAFMASDPAIDAIAAVPYGWQAQDTDSGLFRLGDQAAVIPSLAGEGIGIAVASGVAAARAWHRDGPAAAPLYQREFAARARRPVAAAKMLWEQGERRWPAALAVRALRFAPGLARLAARMTRIGD
jgi:menaquinone-9 beta-reductase